MLKEDQIYTLAIEKHDDAIWLCLNDNNISEKIAQFLSEESAAAFTKAHNLHFSKGYAMAKMGI